MNKSGIVIILLCFLAAAAVVLWERRKDRKTMEEIERMLDAAMTGSFSETNFDESQLSALETKFAHYLSAAETSSRNVAQEKDKIKSLIADISHQTKTPIANLRGCARRSPRWSVPRIRRFALCVHRWIAASRLDDEPVGLHGAQILRDGWQAEP